MKFIYIIIIFSYTSYSIGWKHIIRLPGTNGGIQRDIKCITPDYCLAFDYTNIMYRSTDQPFLGHFSYSIAECLQANYISIELFSKDDMISEKSLSIAVNDYWINMEKHTVLDELNEHLKIVSDFSKVCILLRGAGGKFPTYNILNGGEKGQDGFINNGTFGNVDTLNEFAIHFSRSVSTLSQTVANHQHYGNNELNNINRYIKNVLNIDNITIHTNAGLLKDDSEVYYKSVKLLAESIKILV